MPHGGALLWGSGLAAMTVGLICCASLMAGTQRAVSEAELLGRHKGAAGHKAAAGHMLNSEVFDARQGAQDALVRASRNAMQADLLHEALGGGHPWRHMKNAAAAASAKEAHTAAVHHTPAWQAGEQALAQRNPWASIDTSLWKHDMAMKGKVAKMSLASTEEAAGEGVEEEKSFVPLTHVETKDVKKEWGNGAPHPKALVHGEDRYVTVGQKVQKDDGEEAAWQRRHDIEAQWAHKHQQLASRNANSAHAPTLEGGVSVPGGHVVWMPLKSLAHQPTASRASREHQVVSAREQQAMQFPAQYSKIVEYGPDGQPVATIYGPEAASRGLSSRGRGAALNGVQTLTGAVPPADGTPQKLNAEGEAPINEAKVEQDIIFRLLHDYGAPELNQGEGLTPEEQKDADQRSGKDDGKKHEWYTFGGRVFEGAGARDMPTMLLAITATMFTLLATL